MRRASSAVSRRLRLAVGSLLFGVGFGGLGAACGTRGPVDAEPIADAGLAAADVRSKDTRDDAEGDAGREGGSIVACGTCLIDQCTPSILACVQSSACIAAFQCVATDCLAGGGTPSPACLFKCASGDPQGAAQVLAVYQCVSGRCGTDCGPVLAGLLGGGGGGTPRDGGKKAASAGAGAFNEAFSAWPELCLPLQED